MNIQQLYAVCENLGPASIFHLYKGSNRIGEFDYLSIPAAYEHSPIKGFKIIMETSIIVYV